MKTYRSRTGAGIAFLVTIMAMMIALPASGQTSGQIADNSTADTSNSDNAIINNATFDNSSLDNGNGAEPGSEADSLSDAEAEQVTIDAPVREAVTTHPRIATANTLVCQARHAFELEKAGLSPVITGALEGNSRLVGNVPKTGTANVRGRSFNSDYNNAVDLKVRLRKTLWDANRTRFAVTSGAYGSLEGVVSNIATNTTEDEQQPPYYETFISIENPVFTVSRIRPEVIPGMQVTVDIIGGKRTVLDYILSPIKRASNVAFREI